MGIFIPKLYSKMFENITFEIFGWNGYFKFDY